MGSSKRRHCKHDDQCCLWKIMVYDIIHANHKMQLEKDSMIDVNCWDVWTWCQVEDIWKRRWRQTVKWTVCCKHPSRPILLSLCCHVPKPQQLLWEICCDYWENWWQKLQTFCSKIGSMSLWTAIHQNLNIRLQFSYQYVKKSWNIK